MRTGSLVADDGMTVLTRVREHTREGEQPFRAMAAVFAAEVVIARIALEGAVDLLESGRADLAGKRVRDALRRLLEVEHASTVLCEEGLGLRPAGEPCG